MSRRVSTCMGAISTPGPGAGKDRPSSQLPTLAPLVRANLFHMLSSPCNYHAMITRGLQWDYAGPVHGMTKSVDNLQKVSHRDSVKPRFQLAIERLSWHDIRWIGYRAKRNADREPERDGE